jgi:hypothetical protein
VALAQAVISGVAPWMLCTRADTASRVQSCSAYKEGDVPLSVALITVIAAVATSGVVDTVLLSASVTVLIMVPLMLQMIVCVQCAGECAWARVARSSHAFIPRALRATPPHHLLP